MIEQILLKLFKHVDIVKKVRGEDALYLRRWFVFSRRWGGVYLHKIVRPDDDPDCHDHPWSFVTFILSGGYKEEIYARGDGYRNGWVDECKSGRFYFRPAEHLHRVRLHEDRLSTRFRNVLTEDSLTYTPAWTLVFRGPVRRKWGFVTADGTHVYWREYLNYWGPDANEGGVEAAAEVLQ